MAHAARTFVRRHTRLRPVPDLVGVRLHLADAVNPLWHALQIETGDPDTALPYWAFAWSGGLAIGRYLQAHPDAVAGRHVFDFASGSGLCAMAALRAGASRATCADIDPFAVAAIELNAEPTAGASRSSLDVLDDGAPPVDVILAGDCWYEAALAERVMPWLRQAHEAGIDVLIGDPGRRYLPREELVELASYDVVSTTELEDLDQEHGHVYRLRPLAFEPLHGTARRTADATRRAGSRAAAASPIIGRP
jgi:predicted nicotinamide N-methyase